MNDSFIQNKMNHSELGDTQTYEILATCAIKMRKLLLFQFISSYSCL